MARILWVEDEAQKINGLVRPLIKDNHIIEIANDKKEALFKLNKFKYDLILLDIIIPEGVDGLPERIDPYEGLNLLIKIKELFDDTLPILVLSVVNDKEIINKIREIGVSMMLKKGTLLPSILKKHIYDILGLANETI